MRYAADKTTPQQARNASTAVLKSPWLSGTCGHCGCCFAPIRRDQRFCPGGACRRAFWRREYLRVRAAILGAKRYHAPSKNYEWETPDNIFLPLREEFGLAVDVCATPENAKCQIYFSPQQDGLTIDWSAYYPRALWMNPPYGKEIGRWIRKAYDESTRGATVVCLIPSRTDTSWWHDYCLKGEVRYLRGRICFKGSRVGRAPFPSVIVIFRPSVQPPGRLAALVEAARLVMG